MHKLNEIQAFNSMRLFLEKYYELTSSDDIASLLSGMQFIPGDSTVDPAMWDDWIKSVNKVLSSKNDNREYIKLKK